jgi:DNA-binding NtrC family response regulator
MPKILIIDDEAAIRGALKEILEYESFEVAEAEDGLAGLKAAEKENYDLIFCDIKMPKMDGLEVLEKLKEKGIESPVVIITGHGTVDTAVDALKKGAYDFIQKPLDLNRVLVTVRNASNQNALVNETKTLRKKVNKTLGANIIGESAAITEIKKMIDTVAPTEARVLITGGNGSGKELVARQLHEKSERATAPFIEVNCAAIPTELIESELFGHEKGAFTSAIKTRLG